MANEFYCGRGKQQKFGIKASICLDEIPQEYITTARNGKRYVNIYINEKKAVDQYGYTHSIKVDTWKKEETEEWAPKLDDSMPF